MTPVSYRALADAVFVTHILVITYMLTSVVLNLTGFMDEHPTYQKINLLIIGGIIFSQIVFGGCPLVLLETVLRHQYDLNIQPTGSFTVFLIKSLTGTAVPVMVVTVATYLIGITAFAGWFYTRVVK